ncbi:essential nuclear protein [Salix suchowensis]|nr:essential nuclear protein [Salix suchowensis]
MQDKEEGSIGSGTWTLREAVIVGSIIQKVSIPMLHSWFAPFVNTNETESGEGMEISLSKSLVDLHEMSIREARGVFKIKLTLPSLTPWADAAMTTVDGPLIYYASDWTKNPREVLSKYAKNIHVTITAKGPENLELSELSAKSKLIIGLSI